MNRTTGNVGSTSTIKIYAKNVVARYISGVDDNSTLSFLYTHDDKVEEEDTAPPPMYYTIVNDDFTISSNLTMDTRMDAVESNMVTINTNVSNLDNSVNYTSHVPKFFTKNMKQGTNTAPDSCSTNIDESKLMGK